MVVRQICGLISAGALLLATASPVMAAGKDPFWDDHTQTMHVQIQAVGDINSRGMLCSGTVVSDQHVLTSAHCFEMGKQLSVDNPETVRVCTARLHCADAIRVDLYREGDLAALTMPPGTYTGIAYRKFGIKTPNKALGMSFRACGRNIAAERKRDIDHYSMSCTAENIKSYMYSIRQDDAWPGELLDRPFASAIWGPFPDYQMIRKIERQEHRVVNINAKLNYLYELSSGDSGGGWFSETEDGERLVAVESYAGPEDFEVPGQPRIEFPGAGAVLLEGETLDWANNIVYSGTTQPEPPAITYGEELPGWEHVIAHEEARLRRTRPDLFSDQSSGNAQPSPPSGSVQPQPPTEQPNPIQPPVQAPAPVPVPPTMKPSPEGPPPVAEQPRTPSPAPTQSPQPDSPERRISDRPGPAFPQVNGDGYTIPFMQRFTRTVEPAEQTRVAGENRVDTAIKLFAQTVEAPVAVLATGRSYADGLAGGALAGVLRTGILLTTAQGDDGLEPAVRAQLNASGVKQVYVIGGLAAIGNGVENSLTEDGITFTRLAGSSRFETAERINQMIDRLAPKPGPTLIASGSNFPDALVASSAAARLGGKVVLVDTNHPFVGEGICVGGPACEAAPNATTIIGQDRLETAYLLAARLPYSGKVVAVSASNFPDALAAGAWSARHDATMVLTDGTTVGIPHNATSLTLVGGEQVISPTPSIRS
ncbi:cell wall-binding repeat-containing protein [Stomatohabitans albus]|uniref:cell wall-binding repeat-containing protein n=1 Tax=Stomatohabitans albus TaxID=3110766 RepID=UPI00300C8860